MTNRIFHQLIMDRNFACALPATTGADRLLFSAAGQQAVNDIEKNRVN